MTPLQIATYIRTRTKTNSTTLPDADLILMLGVHMDFLAQRILKIDEDYFGMPQTTDLVLNQREYPLPADLLNKIKFVEVKLDGTNWIPMQEFDILTYKRTTDEATIIENFANEENRAFYDIFRGSLWIYSGAIAAVVGGIKLWAFSWPTWISDLSLATDLSIDPSTVTHGFPRALHKVLCDLVVIDFKSQGDTPIPLTESEKNIEYHIQLGLDAISNANESRIVVPSLPPSSDRGDEGFDY